MLGYCPEAVAAAAAFREELPAHAIEPRGVRRDRLGWPRWADEWREATAGVVVADQAKIDLIRFGHFVRSVKTALSVCP